jgi:hypothetical protein
MSNESSLIANDVPGPVGIDDETHVGYNPRRDLIASGPCAVPVYWLSMFTPSHLATLDVEGEDGPVAVPSLVAEMEEARRLLVAHRAPLAETFPEFQPTWDQFADCIKGRKSRFIKVELQELWDLDAEELLEGLDGAFRWFETRDEEDFALLLMTASIQGYDRTTRTFPAQAGVPRAFHFRGYCCLKKGWDDSADI